MNLIVALFSVFLSVSAQAQWRLPHVHCVAETGLEFKLPDSSMGFMQIVDIRNEFDPKFLQSLITRHAVENTDDQFLNLNVQFGACKATNDERITCSSVKAFGFAEYRYSLNEDFVSVRSQVHGDLSVDLFKDNDGIYQLEFTLKNKKTTGGDLIIKQSMGPKFDPLKGALNAWSPGCAIASK